MLKAIGLAFSNFANFKGRTRRKDYWLFILGCAVVSALISLVAKYTGNFESIPFDQLAAGAGDLTQYVQSGVAVTRMTGWCAWLGSLFNLAILIPTLSITFRRLHDSGRSGWWVLWCALLTPVCGVGSLIMFIFMLLGGNAGENKYGPDPRD